MSCGIACCCRCGASGGSDTRVARRYRTGRCCAGSCTAAHRDPVGVPPEGSRIQLGNDLLAPAAGLERGRRLAATTRSAARQAQRGLAPGLVPVRGRLLPRQGAKRGQHTGPSPVDGGRAGSKHHLITDGHGTPLAVLLTGGNRNDVTQLLPPLDATGPRLRRTSPPQTRRPSPGSTASDAYASAGGDEPTYTKRSSNSPAASSPTGNSAHSVSRC
jgi:hypothetical protein